MKTRQPTADGPETAEPTRSGLAAGTLQRALLDTLAYLQAIDAGVFSGEEREVFRPLIENLRESDPFLVRADTTDNCAWRPQVSAARSDQRRWTRMSVLKSARAGEFCSDRAMREYRAGMWHVPARKIVLG